MKTFAVFELALNLQSLMGCHNMLRVADSHQTPILGGDGLELLIGVLTRIKASCEHLGSDSSLISCINSLALRLQDDASDKRVAVLLAQVDFIQRGIQVNLEKRHFMLLSEEEADAYENPNLFGESFRDKYPAHAMKEVFDAGNCYAASQYTACVFHCMRVAEYGLRKLASNSYLRVRLKHKGKICPVEYAEWQKVIDAIRSKISKIRQRPLGHRREQDLQFLASAADHCEYMKDIWRNEISHTRRWYNKEEALSVINRVKEFTVVVGEHKGSAPAEDSIVKFMEKIKDDP